MLLGRATLDPSVKKDAVTTLCSGTKADQRTIMNESGERLISDADLAEILDVVYSINLLADRMIGVWAILGNVPSWVT